MNITDLCGSSILYSIKSVVGWVATYSYSLARAVYNTILCSSLLSLIWKWSSKCFMNLALAVVAGYDIRAGCNHNLIMINGHKLWNYCCLLEYLPIMAALCLVLYHTYYAQNYIGIIGTSLLVCVPHINIMSAWLV